MCYTGFGRDGNNISRRINANFANIRVPKTISSDFLVENITSGLMQSLFLELGDEQEC